MLPSVYSTFKEPTFGLVIDQLFSDSQNKKCWIQYWKFVFLAPKFWNKLSWIQG